MEVEYARRRIQRGPSLRAMMVIGALSLLVCSSLSAESITYEGQLSQWGVPVSGEVDLRVRIYDAQQRDVSREVGEEQLFNRVPVSAGAFSIAVELPRRSDLETVWLEVDARLEGTGVGFVTLSQRQPIQKAASTRAPLTGAVVFFDLETCPSGWSEFTPAYGRALVGLNPFGTLGAQVGTSLSDRQTPLHRHSYSTGSTTGQAGEHFHRWARTDNVGGQRWISYDQNGAEVLVTTWGNGIGNEGSGHYPLSRPNTYSSEFVTRPGGAHTHSLGSGVTGFEYGDLPYVQLLACVKD